MQGVKAEGLNARLAQIVYTATGTGSVRSVKVLIQGGTRDPQGPAARPGRPPSRSR